MKLSKSDFLVISSILNSNLSIYEKRFERIEKILNKMSKEDTPKKSKMTYDEMAKNIIKISGDEFNRDFNIVKLQ